MLRRTLLGLAAVVVIAATAATTRSGDGESSAIPAPFAPFEHMVGGWKGTAIPPANRLRGWQEKHMWAWKFAKGKPVGMTLAIEGGKIISQAQLQFDDKAKIYRLEGKDAAGKPIAFVGPIDVETNTLTLEREKPPAGSRERLIIRPNTNLIRYGMLLERQESGAPQFAKVIDAGLTKEGEAFASGGAADNLPKCIVTGGAATMAITFQGKTYNLCCTGCRDEFQENPDKYVQKAIRLAAGTSAPAIKTASAPAKEVDPAATEKPAAASPKAAGAAKSRPDRPAAKSKEDGEADPKPTSKTADPATKAAALLSQAQAFEKAGKPKVALVWYQRIVKEFTTSPQAKVAAERIKVLSQ